MSKPSQINHRKYRGARIPRNPCKCRGTRIPGPRKPRKYWDSNSSKPLQMSWDSNSGASKTSQISWFQNHRKYPGPRIRWFQIHRKYHGPRIRCFQKHRKYHGPRNRCFQNHRKNHGPRIRWFQKPSRKPWSPNSLVQKASQVYHGPRIRWFQNHRKSDKCSVQVTMQPCKCIHLSKCIHFGCKESTAWSQRTANRCFRAIPL